MNCPVTLAECCSERNDALSFPVYLEFQDGTSSVVRSRITYAFRVFAAIYGHRVVEDGSEIGTVRCFYGGTAAPASGLQTFFYLPSLYKPAEEFSPRRLVKHRYAGEDFYLAHGFDEQTRSPDWLGEIFEWLSSSYERSVNERDSTARIAYADTIFGRQGISPRKPHATMLMAWLENHLRSRSQTEELPRAPSPAPGLDHIVVASHDIDFHYVDNTSTLVRLFKNLGLALTLYRSPSFLWSNVLMIGKVLAGDRVGDYLARLRAAGKQSSLTSTIFVVSNGKHRRDPNYALADLAPQLLAAQRQGFSVALHASYQSVVENATLNPEVLHFEAVLGTLPRGNRQHWLRFDLHNKLFKAIDSARLTYDSSLGFPDMPGFRNGASFAFPPYDFSNERPHEFLEIPLVLMDGSVEAASRTLHEPAQKITDEILRASRSWAWGGIAALWHNPMEPLSVPEEINEVFWHCVRLQSEHREKWMSAEDFLRLCLKRYQDAGLVEEARIHA